MCVGLSSAYPQQKSIFKDSLQIKEVVVVGSRIDKEIIPVQSLSGVKLRQLSVHSVADALRYFSGVQIKDYGGIGGLKTVNIRSMGSHHVGVFYDGIELGNAQNGVVDLGRFSLDNMESINMYNGQKSDIFQPAKDFASASSIYMTTRVPVFVGDGETDGVNGAVSGAAGKKADETSGLVSGEVGGEKGGVAVGVVGGEKGVVSGEAGEKNGALSGGVSGGITRKKAGAKIGEKGVVSSNKNSTYIKRDNLNVSLKAGSFATINPSLLWEHRFNNRLSSSLSAEYMQTSGEYKFRYQKKNGYDTTEIRKNGDVKFTRVEGALFGRMTDGEWRAKVYLYDSQRGYPGASVRQEPGKFSHQDRQWDRNIFTQGSVRKSFSPLYSLLVNAKYAYDYLHYVSDPRLDVSTMYVDNRYKQQEAYLSAANLFSISDWCGISLSSDFQFNTLDADLVNFVYPTRFSILTAVATSMKFDKFKLQASVLHTYVNDHTRLLGGSAKDKSEFTPTVVASYKPLTDVGLNFRAFYKRVFRMPTLNDLYYTFIGNKNLDPEYTNQYNFGVTYNKSFKHGWLRMVDLQVDGYYNQVEDKIIAMPTSNQFRWTMINLGYVEIRGVEAALQSYWKISELELNLRTNYTYQKAQDFTDAQSAYYGGQIPYVPWHSASMIFGACYGGWSMNYSFIYTGERYESVANIAENYAQPWYTHDISLSKELIVKKMAFRVTAEVNNLFNQQYEVVQCYPMPGTNFKIKLSIVL